MEGFYAKWYCKNPEKIMEWCANTDINVVETILKFYIRNNSFCKIIVQKICDYLFYLGRIHSFVLENIYYITGYRVTILNTKFLSFCIPRYSSQKGNIYVISNDEFNIFFRHKKNQEFVKKNSVWAEFIFYKNIICIYTIFNNSHCSKYIINEYFKTHNNFVVSKENSIFLEGYGFNLIPIKLCEFVMKNKNYYEKKIKFE